MSQAYTKLSSAGVSRGMLGKHGDSRRRVTLAQKIGAQKQDPESIYGRTGVEDMTEEDLAMLEPWVGKGEEFNPAVSGDLSSDDVMNEYSEFGAKDANELYGNRGERMEKDYNEAMAKKSGTGKGLRGFREFDTPSEKEGKYGDIPEGVINDVMEPASESEDVLYGMVEAPSRGSSGGAEMRGDVISGKPISGGKAASDIYDVLGQGSRGSPKAIIKEKEKTAVIPGGGAKNPFPEDSKLGRMFRAIEARGKPGGHELGKVRRPRF